MKFNSIILIIALLNFSCWKSDKNVDESQAKDTVSLSAITYQKIDSGNICELLNGRVYTYLPHAEKESHLFTLKFDCLQDTLKGLIFGPFPEGDHGLAFYKSELKGLVVDDSLNVSFFLIPGELYEEQITLENYNGTLQSFGIDRGEQFFKGKFLADTAINLNCSSEYYDCYTKEQMNFKLKE